MDDGARVLVVGELLVDVAPSRTEPKAREPASALAMTARPGGSPANVAVGLARLGIPSAFAGRIATAGFGPWLREHLEQNDVDLALSIDAAEAATMSIVALDSHGGAAYTFYGPDTADWQWTAGELPRAGALEARAVHTGSIAVALPPGRDVLAAWVRDVYATGETLVSLDPNIRPSLLDDLERFESHLAGLITFCHLVKVSEEDLEALYPGDPMVAAMRWAASGPALVVVTHGAEGATAIKADATTVMVPPIQSVEVVDTVGAGDSFTAGLLCALDRADALSPKGVAEIGMETLAEVLAFANRVAAITCGRQGADPPRLADL